MWWFLPLPRWGLRSVDEQRADIYGPDATEHHVESANGLNRTVWERPQYNDVSCGLPTRASFVSPLFKPDFVCLASERIPGTISATYIQKQTGPAVH